MKKTFGFLTALLFVFLTFALASCESSENPKISHTHEYKSGKCVSCTAYQPLEELDGEELVSAIYSRADETMEALDSYKKVSAVNTEVLISGSVVALKAEGASYDYGVNTDSYVFYEKTNVNTIYENETEEIVYEYGYRDGYMYLLREFEGEKTLFRSPITVSEFLKTKSSELSIDVDFDVFLNCLSKNAQKQQDGSWCTVFTDYNDAALELFWEMLGEDKCLFPRTVTLADVVFTFYVTADMYVRDIEIEFVFENSEEGGYVPVWNVKTTLSDYNSVTLPSDMFDAEVTELADLRLLKDAEDVFLASRFRDNFNFYAEINTDFAGNKSLNWYSGWSKYENGKFSCRYEQVINSEVIIIAYNRYNDKRVEVTKNGSLLSTYVSDDVTEKLNICELSDPLGFDIYSVSSCLVKLEDGKTVYTMKMNPDKDLTLQSLKLSYGFEFKNIDITVTITVENGVVTEITYDNSATFIYDTEEYQLTVNYEATYMYEDA